MSLSCPEAARALGQALARAWWEGALRQRRDEGPEVLSRLVAGEVARRWTRPGSCPEHVGEVESARVAWLQDALGAWTAGYLAGQEVRS